MELMATLQFSPGSSPINIQDQIQANRAWNSRRRRLKFQNRNPLTITIHFRTRTRTRTRRRCEWSLCLLPWWAHLPLSSTNQNPQLFFISFHQKVWTSLSLSLSLLCVCVCVSVYVSNFFSLSDLSDYVVRSSDLTWTVFGIYDNILWKMHELIKIIC